VPQGSVLGPLLFVLFINDVTDKLPRNIVSKLFADDLKTYARITDSSDVSNFNTALKCLTDWSVDWQLPISAAKSYWMRLSNKMVIDYDVDFVLAGNHISEVHEIRDLGVIFDDNLSFTNHISSIIGKARQRLFLLRKSFITKDVGILILAFKTYVLPILEYCSPVWSPCQLHDIKRIESVQRGFTKKLLGYEALTYPERLIKAGLCSLELRRLRSDLVYCYRIVHGQLKVDGILELETRNVTRGHPWKLRASKPRLNTRLHFYEYRVIKVWNSLTPALVCASTVDSFKLMLCKEDLSSHLSVIA
jgi:ribonucleases P/MRP protein subunit RPP40